MYLYLRTCTIYIGTYYKYILSDLHLSGDIMYACNFKHRQPETELPVDLKWLQIRQLCLFGISELTSI